VSKGIDNKSNKGGGQTRPVTNRKKSAPTAIGKTKKADQNGQKNNLEKEKKSWLLMTYH
jgi:hypothetical protein